MRVHWIGVAAGLISLASCSEEAGDSTPNSGVGGTAGNSFGAGGVAGLGSGGAPLASGGASAGGGGTTGLGGEPSGGAPTASGGALGTSETGGAGGDGDGGLVGLPVDAGIANEGGIPSDAADAGAPPFRCTGKPGTLRGKSRQSVVIDGAERWFNYYAPNGLDPNAPAPLVIVPHGYFMDADTMYDVTDYAALADEEQFVVAFPSGAGPAVTDPPWNIGTPAPGCVSSLGFLPMTQNDDQAFLDAIIGLAETDQCIDRDHVFMAGFSMGAYFSNTTGCNRDTIKAIAPHSGGSHDFAGCPVTKKPVLLMHFEGDALIPYACGTEARDRWLALNGCQSSDPEVRTVTGGRCEYYQGCTEGGQVAMCTFDTPPGGDELFAGHGWSGGFEPQPVFISGYSIPETESATRLSWEFFKEFGW